MRPRIETLASNDASAHGQRLAVHDLGGDAGQSFGGGALAQAGDHAGREVGREDTGPGACGHQAEGARARGHVDHAFTRFNLQQLQRLGGELPAEALERLFVRRRDVTPSLRHLIRTQRHLSTLPPLRLDDLTTRSTQACRRCRARTLIRIAA